MSIIYFRKIYLSYAFAVYLVGPMSFHSFPAYFLHMQL